MSIFRSSSTPKSVNLFCSCKSLGRVGASCAWSHQLHPSPSPEVCTYARDVPAPQEQLEPSYSCKRSLSISLSPSVMLCRLLTVPYTSCSWMHSSFKMAQFPQDQSHLFWCQREAPGIPRVVRLEGMLPPYEDLPAPKPLPWHSQLLQHLQGNCPLVCKLGTWQFTQLWIRLRFPS